MRNTSYRYWMIYVIAIVAAMGGLLFGFDTGVISGAIPFFQKDFGIDDSMVEVVTSSGLLGAILGALCCGKLTDRIGRRKVILTSAVIFAIGALWSGWAPDIYHLIAARLFLGVAIGISSFAVPLYIAEVSPAKSRGMFVAMFQLMITIGLLVSYLSDLYFADETSVSCWRPMFYVGVIPAIILFVGMLLVPPSPRWLMSVGREEESLSVLKMVEHPDLVNASFEQMRNEMRKNDERQGRFKDLAQPWLRNALVIAIGIMEGLSGELLQEGLQSFPGVKRRFTIEENGDNVYIDDYAHHPTAVKYMIEAARIKYPGKKVIALFKPDRYSRIYYFMDRFAEELNQADEVYLCHFPENAAREDGIDITISDLADKCEKATVINEDEEAARMLAQRGPAVYLFMSSKDIYKLKNIVKTFQ